MFKNKVFFIGISLLIILFCSACSITDPAAQTGDNKTIENSTNEKKNAAFVPLTEDEITVLLQKEVLRSDEINALKATLSMDADSRSFDILAWLQPVKKSGNIYNIYCWYSLNERFDSIRSTIVVFEEQYPGWWKQVGPFNGYRAPAPAGSNWDAAARNIHGPGYAVGEVTGYLNGRVKTVRPQCSF